MGCFRTCRAHQATAYTALLDALRLEDPVIVMGVSAGGPSAIAFAALFPERTAALVLAEAESQRAEQPETGDYPFFLKNDFLCWALFRSVEKFVGQAGVIAMMTADSKTQALLSERPAQAREFASLIWALWPLSQRLAGARNDGAEFATMELPAADIRVPTFIIHGNADRNVPFAASEKLAATIRGAVLHVVDGGDHWIPWTHRDEVTGSIDAFLRGLDLLHSP